MNKPKNFFWTVINSITSQTTIIPRSEFKEKEYKPFVIMKVLSYDFSLAPYIQSGNYTHGIKDHAKYAHYLALFHCVDKRWRTFRRPTNIKISDEEKEDLILFQKFFRIRKSLVPDYLSQLTADQVNKIISCQKQIDS